MIHCRIVDSPIGPLALAGYSSVLTNLRMVDHTYEPSRVGWLPEDDAFAEAVSQLDAYFSGELNEFAIELDLRGTEFQQRVWRALKTIPYGETRSYGEIAKQVGAPGAARAVGLANSRNPIPVIVPCHRVIGASGQLTGYSGGLERKLTLLELEKDQAPANLTLLD
ncbi:methylated-DNA--[protein]-cysteine S-methyltransferase [Mycobacterium lepromatosis]|uniref:Methylated-DNA--protein-cysteine methyltransferase n=1 Tax=Mycobacterium lepromatosis TaxID=480418 RepID=A0A0F4ER09_9MYCO|nr:methylated-DNA--[protein]-cysteine S-methyltransferase [Mycobacterium lepromatosis]KJX75328.1 methylated-DNA-- protein-cysteine methyltransferase [Mycobacterium lepromatosis]UKN42287.1 methylated-DNA--protein-cysteine methyltransferase [Mycobacterium lepromatosis]